MHYHLDDTVLACSSSQVEFSIRMTEFAERSSRLKYCGRRYKITVMLSTYDIHWKRGSLSEDSC